MRKISSSPLVNTLVLLNGIFGCLVLISTLLPLPGYGGRFDSHSQIDEEPDIDVGFEIDAGAVLARPVFSSNRRPPAPVASVPVSSAPAPRIEVPFILVGIMGNSERDRTAYLQHNSTGETVSVRVGQYAGDWQVDTVGQNFVTLVFGNERRVIELGSGG